MSQNRENVGSTKTWLYLASIPFAGGLAVWCVTSFVQPLVSPPEIEQPAAQVEVETKREQVYPTDQSEIEKRLENEKRIQQMLKDRGLDD